jgi:hypothetical protein
MRIFLTGILFFLIWIFAVDFEYILAASFMAKVGSVVIPIAVLLGHLHTCRIEKEGYSQFLAITFGQKIIYQITKGQVYSWDRLTINISIIDPIPGITFEPLDNSIYPSIGRLGRLDWHKACKEVKKHAWRVSEMDEKTKKYLEKY